MSAALIRIELLFALALCGFLLLALSGDKLAMRVSPQVVYVGHNLVLTCHVPRDERNRVLDYGIVDYREHSQRQLDGEFAPVTWQFVMERIPCDVGPAYCSVGRNDLTWTTVSETLEIVGCN